MELLNATYPSFLTYCVLSLVLLPLNLLMGWPELLKSALGWIALIFLPIPLEIAGEWLFQYGTVRIEGHPEQTVDYVWGDKSLMTFRCKICGCATHWEPIDGELGARHGVNLNNFDPRLQELVKVRHFDGADTWTFID
jgi:hypothetical protein